MTSQWQREGITTASAMLMLIIDVILTKTHLTEKLKNVNFIMDINF